MTCHHVFGFLKKVTSIHFSLSALRPVTMSIFLAIALTVLILSSNLVLGAGGLEVEIGDVQGNETRPNLNNGKQDETEKARLKAVDEKIKRAEEEGNYYSPHPPLSLNQPILPVDDLK